MEKQKLLDPSIVAYIFVVNHKKSWNSPFCLSFYSTVIKPRSKERECNVQIYLWAGWGQCPDSIHSSLCLQSEGNTINILSFWCSLQSVLPNMTWNFISVENTAGFNPRKPVVGCLALIAFDSGLVVLYFYHCRFGLFFPERLQAVLEEHNQSYVIRYIFSFSSN